MGITVLFGPNIALVDAQTAIAGERDKSACHGHVFSPIDDGTIAQGCDMAVKRQQLLFDIRRQVDGIVISIGERVILGHEGG